MSSSVIFLSATDRELIELFEGCEEFFKEAANITNAKIIRSAGIGPATIPNWVAQGNIPGPTPSSKQYSNMRLVYNRNEQQQSYNNYAITLEFTRFPQDSLQNQLSPNLNKIAVTTSGSASQIPQEKPLLLEIWFKINEFVSSRQPATLGREESAVETALASFNNLKAIHEMLVAQLAEQSTQISSKATEQAAKLSDEFDTRNKLLTADFDKQKKQLDEAKAALDAREKLLDNRSHMHVRRDLRQSMATDLKARLEGARIPKSAADFRNAIIGTCIVGLFFFAYVGIFSTIDLTSSLNLLSQNQVPVSAVRVSQIQHSPNGYVMQGLYYLALKGVLASIGFAVVLFYLLGWLKRTHDVDIRAERDLERYRYDLDRASWVIETVLEAKEKENSVVPSLWLEAATRSMFTRQTVKNTENDPLDALSSLLNMTAKAEIGTNGTRLELGRGDLKKVARGHDQSRDED